jgi:hypothetical protein
MGPRIADEHEPDLNLLAAHLEDRLDGPERDSLVEHLAGCAECRETLAMLARGADLLPRPVSAASASPRRWRVPVIAWLPLAATLVVAVATLTRLDWWTPSDEGRPPAVAPASPAPTRVTAGPAPSALPSAPERSQTSPAGLSERVLVLRGAQRRVAGKSFRLVFGEWIAERSELVARSPALAPYAELGERVLVVHDGTVYRLGPDPAR